MSMQSNNNCNTGICQSSPEVLHFVASDMLSFGAACVDSKPILDSNLHKLSQKWLILLIIACLMALLFPALVDVGTLTCKFRTFSRSQVIASCLYGAWLSSGPYIWHWSSVSSETKTIDDSQTLAHYLVFACFSVSLTSRFLFDGCICFVPHLFVSIAVVNCSIDHSSLIPNATVPWPLLLMQSLSCKEISK